MPSYPQSGTDYPRTEILIDGTWTDISPYPRGEGGTNGIMVTRGRADAQSRVSAQTSGFTLNNRDGRFSDRNPSSPYYGKLQNAQIRQSAGLVTGDCYLWCPYSDQQVYNDSRTADKAALDVVGDLEIRADIWPHTWRPNENGTGSRRMVLASKYTITGDQRSWHLSLTSAGLLQFAWTTAGTVASRITVNSTVSIPATADRLSVKVTLDVDNGAAGRDVKFWTATSIDGTYTQLGATVTAAGVTNVFASTSPLVIGAGGDNATIFDANGLTFGGRFYEFRLYNGIGGSLVADPKFYNASTGQPLINDGLGNSWQIDNGARVTSDRYRFHGELASMPLSWDTTGRDVYVRAQAAGLLRRLNNPGASLRSPMYRQFIQYGAVTGYWPMEDDNGAATLASALTNGRPGQRTLASPGSSGSPALPGASSVVAFTDTGGTLNFTTATATATGTLSLMVYLKLSAIPAPAPGGTTLITLYTTGTARRIEIGLDNVPNWHVDFYDASGTNISSTTTAGTSTDPRSGWIGFNLLLETSGANINRSVRWLRVGSGSPFLGIGPDTYAGKAGVITQIKISAAGKTEYQDAQFSHLLVANADIGFVNETISDASNAYAGETAATRVARLCGEESIPVEVIGMWADSAPMGYQSTDTLVNLLYACQDTDLGLLAESRSLLALVYHTRGDLWTRRDLELSYTSSQLSAVPQPIDDDQNIANDVTVSRTNGSSYRYTMASGRYGTATIGTFQRSWSCNAQMDSQLKDVAGVLIGQGVWPEARIPALPAALHRSEIPDGSALFRRVAALDLAETLALIGMPVPMPPDETLLIVQGLTETLTQRLWDIAYNVTPAKPLQVGTYDTASVAGLARFDTSGSTLNTTITTTGTTVILNSASADDTWTVTGASYPFDIMMEGERIRLNSAPGGSTTPQTFTGVTRSINGVVKAHNAGAPVSLAEPFFWG